MGMDAEVHIWVGFRSEDCDLELLKDLLPKDMFDEDGYTPYGNRARGVVEKYGVLIQEFSCCEETVGLGVEVFRNDWDDTVEFDPMKIREAIEVAKVSLNKILQDCKIIESVGTWCQTDYY